ncbi:hypothetical protein ACJ73_07828 [Blastomyces percursus]|uniref:Uncharacterized protein n=1 Tax=Blastomyces percursus TaxID=1658174 RepID=A0A1J9QKT5_9EURO|nr:hypothetical protein ACJ73_07828 [Blastomyces percursus]
MPRSNAPESQFSGVELPSQFDLNALIESKGLFISQETVIDFSADSMLDHNVVGRAKNHFSIATLNLENDESLQHRQEQLKEQYDSFMKSWRSLLLAPTTKEKSMGYISSNSSVLAKSAFFVGNAAGSGEISNSGVFNYIAIQSAEWKSFNIALSQIYQRMTEAQKLTIESKQCPSCQDYMGIPCEHYIRERIDERMPLELHRIHPHWLYDRDLGCYLQRAELGEVAYPNTLANEPLRQRQRQADRDQHLVMAPADDEQYTVYMTEAGPVVGSGSAIPSSTAPAALNTPNTPNTPQSARKRSATLTSPLRSSGRQNRTIRKFRYNVLSQTISQSFWEILGGEEDARDETLEMPVLGSRNTQDAH